jgi:hypothetical protein
VIFRTARYQITILVVYHLSVAAAVALALTNEKIYTITVQADERGEEGITHV